MQSFNGQETVMDSLQNGIWKFWTGQQISDYCAINVWHAYKYLDIAPVSADIQSTFGLSVCLNNA